MNKHDPRRLSRFTTCNMYPINDVVGFGIYSIKDKSFVGFQTSKGLISIWNEPRKAKLAFSYHTKNTIDERAGEYEVREIKSVEEMYGRKS